VESVNTMHYTTHTHTHTHTHKVREFNHMREKNAIEIQFINFEDFISIS
jgi:hypothetical protein